ncbi:hypothetical protein ebA750 [Aromatoleum aromaticum EbN1]|uniref:Uncharacterized protein n=1 Tax=Aromatoleum aromaticum (strain DSM 19018 / LMG 30748 / EbN1) TaxID=76114 RepID=Q5P856_AROAE|nr:hypothetical protein ebA750 [Aromatoleum aromaticum EbN1]
MNGKSGRKGRFFSCFGGSGEIRTHERLPVAGFQVCRNLAFCSFT